MKTRQSQLSSICIACALAASCSSKEPPRIENSGIEPQIYAAAAYGTDSGGAAPQEKSTESDAVYVAYGADNGSAKPKPQKKSKAGSAVDIDLTVMSGTMVYATIYKIMSSPKGYIGKTIRARGPYNSVYFEDTGLYYHFVVIEDATACCKQGLEFKWNGTHAYPADYPAEETRIEVAGVFGSYNELDKTYYYLAVDEVKIKK